MKVRKKQMVLRGCRDTGKWYLAEGAKKLPNGNQQLTGRVYEVTESVAPALSHTNTYVRRLEDALLKTVKELYAARGLTCSDHDLSQHFAKLREDVSKVEKTFNK